MSPWWSACLPSVEDTCVWLISLRLIGSAPISRNFARSCASCTVRKPPEIWAPVRPSMPSGFSLKSMNGRVTTLRSRTTAKVWNEVWAG